MPKHDPNVVMRVLDAAMACGEAKRWVQKRNLSLTQAWQQCCAPDWMLYLATTARFRGPTDAGWRAIAAWLIQIDPVLERHVEHDDIIDANSMLLAWLNRPRLPASPDPFLQYSWSTVPPEGASMPLRCAMMDLRFVLLDSDITNTWVRPWAVAAQLCRVVAPRDRDDKDAPTDTILKPYADLVRKYVDFNVVKAAIIKELTEKKIVPNAELAF